MRAPEPQPAINPSPITPYPFASHSRSARKSKSRQFPIEPEMTTMGIIASVLTGTSGTNDVHEKAGDYRQNRGISTADTENQVLENKQVTNSYYRLARVEKKEWQNEGISQHIYENK
jgi:hypothetical protein